MYLSVVYLSKYQINKIWADSLNFCIEQIMLLTILPRVKVLGAEDQSCAKGEMLKWRPAGRYNRLREGRYTSPLLFRARL